MTCLGLKAYIAEPLCRACGSATLRGTLSKRCSWSWSFQFSPSGSVRWPSTPRCGFFKFCNVRYSLFFFPGEAGFWCRCPPQVGDLRWKFGGIWLLHPSNIHQTHLTWPSRWAMWCLYRAAVELLSMPQCPGICYGKKPVVLRGLDAPPRPLKAQQYK